MEIASNSGISIWNLRKKNSFWFENFPIEATDLNNRGFANGAAGLSHWIIFFISLSHTYKFSLLTIELKEKKNWTL